MKHIASLSGGRTSTGPLPKDLIEKYGADNVDLVFCDTGAEHADTYRFIRDAEIELGKKITCLKLIMPKKDRAPSEFVVCGTDEIGPDYFAWIQLTNKYGNPYIPGGKFCTNEMKTKIFKKYCNQTYGEGNFYTWIGYRFEEGNRIWGDKASKALGKLGMTNTEKTEFFLECLNSDVDTIFEDYYPSMFPSNEDEKQKGFIKTALETIKETNYRFMCELNSLNKQDVIALWSLKPNDLKIDEHLTNCIFCPEKPEEVVMLAIKDAPDDARKFLEIVERESLPVKIKRDGTIRDQQRMYRKGSSFRRLYDLAQSMNRDEILQLSRIGKKLAAKNPCSSGSCDALGRIHEDQQELF